MKLITRNTDYAIRALCCISGTNHSVITVTDLSKKLDMPRPFLRKILQTLNKAGLLKSSKGSGGGFFLVARPDKITVFNLMEIFQGPFKLGEHTFKGKICPHIKRCRLKKKMDKIEKHTIQRLKSITIASLL